MADLRAAPFRQNAGAFGLSGRQNQPPHTDYLAMVLASPKMKPIRDTARPSQRSPSASA